MKSTIETGKLAEALVKAQAEVMAAHKDSTNPFFKSSYADLESVWDAIRMPLTKNGLSVAQGTDYVDGAGTCVVTRLMHVSGQWIEGCLPVSAIKNDPQSQGSAITYARRYALAGMVGVVQVDDDGEGALGRAVDSPLTKEHSISNVSRAPTAAPAKDDCQHTWFNSKYADPSTGEFGMYCAKCRAKKSKGAA